MPPSIAVAERTALAFRIRRRFNASRENLFRAWTDPEALQHWWCPEGWAPAEIEIDLRAGGAYRIGMRRLAGGAPVYVTGKFLEVSAPGKLVYTWQWQNAFDGMPETRVTVEFLEAGPASEVLLIHENLTEAGICLRHRAGWLASWERLERSLAGDKRDMG